MSRIPARTPSITYRTRADPLLIPPAQPSMQPQPRDTKGTSVEFARFCQGHGIRTSVGRTGVCLLTG